jgi:anti-sigma B factor antagonist
MDTNLDIKINGKPLTPAIHLIAIEGEIDIYTVPTLKHFALEVIDEGYRFLILNLDGVKFIDSTGLGMLIGLSKRLIERSGRLSLICNNFQIKKLLYITGLDEVFHVFTGEEEALKALDTLKE